MSRSSTEDERSATRPRDRGGALGPALRRAWVGYQRRLDAAMAAAGFEDRRFPDGRVLRMCRDSPDVTISRIGRELGITRQGAGKVVADLSDRGYVTVDPSPRSRREKSVTITPRALEYLAAQRTAARMIERRLRTEIGADAFQSAELLLRVLGGNEDGHLRDYLRRMGISEV